MGTIRAIEIDPATGLFVGDLPHHPDDDLGANIVTTPVPEGFQTPRWNGSAWEEGATDAQRLAAIKAIKKRHVKSEGLIRMQAIYPALVDFEMVLLVRDLILSIAPAARQVAADLQTVQSIWQAGKDAISAIDAISDLATAIAYDPVSGPSWP